MKSSIHHLWVRLTLSAFLLSQTQSKRLHMEKDNNYYHAVDYYYEINLQYIRCTGLMCVSVTALLTVSCKQACIVCMHAGHAIKGRR